MYHTSRVRALMDDLPALRDLDSSLSSLSWDSIRRLTLRLGVPKNKLDDFESENPTSTSGRKLGALEYWLHSDVDASWAKLAETLVSFDEVLLAREIGRKYCPAWEASHPGHPVPIQSTATPPGPTGKNSSSPYCVPCCVNRVSYELKCSLLQPVLCCTTGPH